MATFPAIAPIHPAPKRTAPLNSNTLLGDGYEMSLRFGLNNVRPEWSLTWETTAANATTIDDFLQARADAGEAFDWQPPDTATALLWRCDEWTVEHLAFNWRRVNATFRQVFEIAGPAELLAGTGSFTLSGGGASPPLALVAITVTVQTKTVSHPYYGIGSALGYYLDGVESPLLTVVIGNTYRFNQNDPSNASHQLLFYTTADKTTPYTTNVTTVGTAGSAGAYTQIVITGATPATLHYQCVNHAYMGNAITLQY